MLLQCISKYYITELWCTMGSTVFYTKIGTVLFSQPVYKVADVCNITDGTRTSMNPGRLIKQKIVVVKNSGQALARVELATFWFEAKRSIH